MDDVIIGLVFICDGDYFDWGVVVVQYFYVCCDVVYVDWFVRCVYQFVEVECFVGVVVGGDDGFFVLDEGLVDFLLFVLEMYFENVFCLVDGIVYLFGLLCLVLEVCFCF